MTILVTGGLGQVGRFLTRSLIEKNEKFTILDKRDSDEFSDVKIIHPEITQKESFAKYKPELEQVKTLVHLASLITNDRDVIKSGPDSIDLNIKGTINLLEFLPNLENICFSSTYMVYGTPQTNPVTEEHPTNPNVVYGASKLATEKFLQIFAKENDVNLSILRLMGIYGVEKPHGQAIPSFIKSIANDQNPTIFGTGKERRNHLHMDDAVSAILTSIKAQKIGIFNIGGPDSPSNLELIEEINNYLDKKIEPVFKKQKSKAYDFISDISKSREHLEFKPKLGFKEGLTKTIEKFLKNGW